MAVSARKAPKDYQFEELGNYSENEGSDTSYNSDDLARDPIYSALEDTCAKFSKFSIKKRSEAQNLFGKCSEMEGKVLGSESDTEEAEMVAPAVDQKDEKSFKEVQKIIEAGKLEKLKVDQCKVYLRKNDLRLTGNKDTLIQRIKEHLEILNGGWEKKYPVSSFVLNCKGDACTGDVVLFEQNVYEMFNIASRSAGAPPCGKRIVAGRILKESYGAAKQQHTFTIEVLWSKGEKPYPPLHPLLIKGRNLYRLKTLRQRWDDEEERQIILMDKHSRGFVARSDREVRIQEKGKRKMIRANRKVAKEPHQPKISTNNRHHSQRDHASQNTFQCQSQYKTNHTRKYEFHENYKQPNFYSNHHRSFGMKANGFRESSHRRQPLTSMNHCPPVMPRREEHMQKQLCQYYAQGRCYYGDNCKFYHEVKEMNRWPGDKMI
ncbi:Zinc finger CCCH domain-containing protein 62 [Quillaja saponaria]|uniref:Zinc finger CCCH domain-containing protein 62 n=1 Tax=Quillaja saponaria TaxID=32244 RepID=A0AAD7LSF4_QUISA|nr:Zinc finger CCCH domain-containing protein 62 [Quillaja saponaria]